jgi:uncharacterized protein YaiL (DUF2058 family)
MTDDALFHIVNERWGKLLGQAMAQIILLEKEIASLGDKVTQLDAELVNRAEKEKQLRSRLHQAEIDLIAAQGKAVIDDGAEGIEAQKVSSG